MKHGEHSWINDGTNTSPCANGCGVRMDQPEMWDECPSAGDWVPCESIRQAEGSYRIVHYDGTSEASAAPPAFGGYWCYRRECLDSFEQRHLPA